MSARDLALASVVALAALLGGGARALAQGGPGAPGDAPAQAGAPPKAGDAAPAPQGKGAVPRISGIQPDTVFSGGVVEVRGTNFSDAREDLVVTVDGAPAVVLEATVAAVKVMLPAVLEKGTHSILVEVGGRRSNRADVKVIPQSERSHAAEEASKKYEHPEATPELAAKLIVLDLPEPTEDRGSFFVRLRGEARLPDGCMVNVSLKLGDESLAALNLEVKDKRFQGAFGPFALELFAGNYWVDATFNIQRQSREIREVFNRTFTDPTDRAIHEEAKDRQACRIGTQEQEVAQRRQVREHIAQTIVRVRRLVRRLENAVGAAARGAFSDGKGGVDEAAWIGWLDARVLRNVKDPGARQARLEEMRKRRGFVGADGIFREKLWREWVEFGFRPDVVALEKNHFDYKNRFIAIKYPTSMIKLEELFGMVGTLAESRSRALYDLMGMDVPAAFRERESRDPAQIGGGQVNVTPGAIVKAGRDIEREVELTAAELAAAESAIPLED